MSSGIIPENILTISFQTSCLLRFLWGFWSTMSGSKNLKLHKFKLWSPDLGYNCCAALSSFKNFKILFQEEKKECKKWPAHDLSSESRHSYWPKEIARPRLNTEFSQTQRESLKKRADDSMRSNLSFMISGRLRAKVCLTKVCLWVWKTVHEVEDLMSLKPTDAVSVFFWSSFGPFGLKFSIQLGHIILSSSGPLSRFRPSWYPSNSLDLHEKKNFGECADFKMYALT